jgi:integrase
MFPQMDQIRQLDYVRSLFAEAEVDQWAEIEDFFVNTAQMPYIDKVTSGRYARFFLEFLKQKAIRSWGQMDPGLMNEFEKWRRETAVARNGWDGAPPSVEVVNRNIQFVKKAFDEARDMEFIKRNPLKNWNAKPHVTPRQQSLTIDELHKVLSHKKWQQDYLVNGSTKVQLGFKLLDYILLLFVSCKRRKEILRLSIPNINYAQNWAHYIEHKNSSKGKQYITHKAFWLTPAIKQFLKRITQDRDDGLVFPRPGELQRSNATEEALNGDYLSQLFAEIVAEVVPKKHVTLKNLRQTATSIMEAAGLSDNEQDAALGHIQIKTALPFYQDRSDEAIARRISNKTMMGIEVLSSVVEDFLTGKLPQ